MTKYFFLVLVKASIKYEFETGCILHNLEILVGDTMVDALEYSS